MPEENRARVVDTGELYDAWRFYFYVVFSAAANNATDGVFVAVADANALRILWH